jgi:hypothetical protein
MMTRASVCFGAEDTGTAALSQSWALRRPLLVISGSDAERFESIRRSRPVSATVPAPMPTSGY